MFHVNRSIVQRVGRSEETLWEPSPKQAQFLTSSAYETLFGGAAGGGKTEALIMDVLGLHIEVDGEPMPAIDQPRYWGLLVRRYGTDLSQLWDRCSTIYHAVCPGVRENKQKRHFIFPSGAHIELSHAESEASVRNKYKGIEFQYLGFEELTEHPSEDGYTYLLTRTRRAGGMHPKFPVRVRATTNPDGPGNDWVRERWRISDEGHSVPAFEVRGRVREFIRSRVYDNPHIDPDYEGTLQAQSEQRRRALLQGRWDIIDIEGSIYKVQYHAAIAGGRIGIVPIETSVPVHTFWDIGQNDAMAVWFMQKVGLQNRFVDYYEASHVPLEHFARILREKEREHGYIYGTHYLPHDAAHKQLGRTQNESVEELLNDLEIEPTTIVERIPDIIHGIELTRRAWASCWFDAERCKQGLKCLKFYRYKIDKDKGTAGAKPLHDWSSNGADAFRQFAQGFSIPHISVSQMTRDRRDGPEGYSRNLKRSPVPTSGRRSKIYG